MNTPKARVSLFVWPAIAVAIAGGCSKSPSLPSVPKSPAAAQGHPTPDAVFAAFKAAVAQKAWSQAAACLTPDSQRSFAFAQVMGASFDIFEDEAKSKSLETLLTKHGVELADDSDEADSSDDFDEGIKTMFQGVRDIPTLLDDLQAWRQANTIPDKSELMVIGDLSDVKISNDRATGSVGTERGVRPIEFRNSGQGWLVHMPQ